MTISSREREQRLVNAVEKLSKYYGIRTFGQDIAYVTTPAYIRSVIDGSREPLAAAGEPLTPSNDAVVQFINDIFNSPQGALPIEEMTRQLNSRLTATSDSYPVGNIIQIIGDTPEVVRFRTTLPTRDNTTPGIIQTYNPNIKNVSIFSTENTPAGPSVPIVVLDEAERQQCNNKSINILFMTAPNLNISNRYAKPVSMFLNGVPPIEMSKAVPYVEVQFELPLPAVDENNRLLAPSIYKAMLGGVLAERNTPLALLQSANSSSIPGENSRNFTTVGMEAFTSPQTLYNRRYAGKGTDIRANQVLDPTRPLMSIKQFSTSEIPSFAMYGYRSATLRMALHDRSRMPDFAPFFRADLRGTTQVKIEYGWHHPEGEDLIRARRENASPYVDLINGMRRVEKYQIRNSSFSFRENGGVDISLDLVTLGQSQLTTELIVREASGALLEQIRELERLQTSLSNALARTNLISEESSSSSDRPSVEIRGTEILNAASDAFTSGFNLTPNDRVTLLRLLGSLREGPRAEVRALTDIRNALLAIWGPVNRGVSREPRRAADLAGDETRVGRIRASISSDVQNQVNALRNFCLGRPSPDGSDGNWPNEPIGDPLVINARPDTRSAGRLPGLSGATGTGPGGSGGGRRAGGGAGGGGGGGEPPPRDGEAPENSPPTPAQAADAAPPATSGTPTPPGGDADAPSTPRTGGGGGGRGLGTLPEYLRSGRGYGDGLHRYSVSLATLMTNFVATPLLKTGTYKEIQLIFYPFNENAAYASRINIGNFEINLGMLTEALIQYRIENTSRSAMLTLSEFWSFINTNFIDNPAASAYGLWDENGEGFFRGLTRARITEIRRENPSAPVIFATEPRYDETTLNSRISETLRDVTPTGEFRPPQLRLFTECLPVKYDTEEGGSTRTTENGTTENILRIHVYDQQSSSTPGVGELLLAERNRALSLAARPSTTDAGTTSAVRELWADYRNGLIERAQNAKIIIPAGINGDRFVINGGARAIKDFVMNNVPYLIPGMQNSGIKSVNLSSLQDEAASTLNLVNSPRTAELISPNGEEPGNLPLQIIPVEMSMTTLGCPLIAFGSQFFVDLNTGTTADDIYAINQISSEFEPGKYTTNIKFRPISGYTRYRNFLNEIREAIDRTEEASAEAEGDEGGTTP